MTTHFFGDTAVLLQRTLRHVTRSIDTILTVSIMPIALMLLFRYVFSGAISTGLGPGHYLDYLLPGILLVTIATGISYTTLRLFTDKQTGIFARFQSLPIARSSVLWAHVLTSVASTLISLVIVVLIAVGMRFRSAAGALAWLAVTGIIVLFTLAVTWIAVIAGLSAKTAEEHASSAPAHPSATNSSALPLGAQASGSPSIYGEPKQFSDGVARLFSYPTSNMK
jgi:ABC-2 type transport system permease protein